MAQYDGSIRINTKIDSKGASSQLMSLENRIVKTADKVSSLRSEMDALKSVKIPTQEYSEITAQIQKAEAEFNKLLEKQEQMQREGKDNGVAWERLNYKMEEVGNTIRYAQGELQDLVSTGKAFTLGSDTDHYANLGQQLKYAENDLSVLNLRHDELIAKQGSVSNGYKKIGDTAKKSFDKINKSSKKSGGLLGTMATRFKGLALSLLIFNQISKAFNAMTSGIKQGFENFYNANDSFKNSVDGLKASLLTLKNSFAAAFAPLVQSVIPYIQKAVEWITALINKIGQIIAAVSGQKTYLKAVKQTTAAIKDQNKAQNKQLSSLDKLNNLTSDKGSENDGGAGSMFEEVPIDKGVLEFLQKIKDFLKPIIDYAKKLKDVFMQGFWDGLGDWEYRWESIKESLKSIKDNLIDIWTDPLVLEAADGWAQSIAYTLGSLVGSLASIGLTIATNLIGGIEKYIDQNKDRIKKHLIAMFNVWEDINNLLSDFFQAFAYVFEAFASEQGQQLTANIIGIFADAFMGAREIAFKLSRDILNIIIQPFVDNKEAFRTALEGFLSILSEVSGTIKQGIDETFDKLNEVYDEHLKPFFDSIAQGLSDTAGKFLEFWNGNVQPILKKWASQFDSLWKEHLQPMLNNFMDLIGSVADYLKMKYEKYLQPLVDFIIDYILPGIISAMDSVSSYFFSAFEMISDVVSGIIKVMGGITDFLTGIFTVNWKKAWDGIVKIFEGVLGAVKGIVNGVLGLAEVLANGIIGAINFAINALNHLKIDFPSWIPGIGGKNFGLNIPQISQVSIPRLATGTVVPPNREFMAVLGDNKREPEIVSPISTMKQAFKEAMLEIGGGIGNGKIELHVTANVDGRTLFEVTQDYAMDYFDRTGQSPYPI